jgi:uncharacterized protein (DUF58 family)
MRAFMQRRMAQWIRRRQGEDVLPVTLQRRRLYILPTRTGMAFGVLLLLMLIAGLNYANSLALLTTFLLAGLALISMHACHRNLLGLTVTDLSSQDSFAGGEAQVQVRLANPGAPARVGIELETAAGAAVACAVPADGTVAVHLKIATPVRGAMPIGRLRIRTTWPFGLFRGWTWLHVADEVTVYPRPHGSRPMPLAAGARSGSTSRDSGELDEWATLRAFRDGDSPRQVAWKAYARGAPLLVKEYTASGSAERLFDFSALAGLDTEQRLSQLAKWIATSAADDERFALKLPRRSIELDQGPGHRQRCLRALARYGLEERAGD